MRGKGSHLYNSLSFVVSPIKHPLRRLVRIIDTEGDRIADIDAMLVSPEMLAAAWSIYRLGVAWGEGAGRIALQYDLARLLGYDIPAPVSKA